MKKRLKRVLLGIGIVVLILTLFTTWNIFRVKAELKKMAPLATMQIVDNIFSIKDSYADLYLIKDSDQYIAIDGGNDTAVISEELKGININPDKVAAVLLTHSDADHVAAIKLFKNAKVYLSKQEEPLINGQKSRMLFFGNKIETKSYILLEDQQSLNIGKLTIKGFLTPGHTIGSICYLINGKYLFTGDAMSLKDGKIDRFNDFFNMDSKRAAESMGNITQIPTAQYIFSAHYGYTADYKNAVKDWKNRGN